MTYHYLKAGQIVAVVAGKTACFPRSEDDSKSGVADVRKELIFLKGWNLSQWLEFVKLFNRFSQRGI